MKIKYCSCDHQTFDDPLACARHELHTQPHILKTVEFKLCEVAQSTRLNWCESGACACTGCINQDFLAMGLTRYHWEVWRDEFMGDASIVAQHPPKRQRAH